VGESRVKPLNPSGVIVRDSMHEWALAEGVILTALRAAEERKANKILRVRVKLGELQQVEEEIFTTALKELSKDTLADGAEFSIVRESTTLRCNRCSNEWKVERNNLDSDEAELIHFLPEAAHVYLKCPKCGSPDFTIKSGRGVWIESVEVE